MLWLVRRQKGPSSTRGINLYIHIYDAHIIVVSYGRLEVRQTDRQTDVLTNRLSFTVIGHLHLITYTTYILLFPTINTLDRQIE